MRVRCRVGYGMGVVLSMAVSGSALRAQATTHDDAKWLDECREHWGGDREAHSCELRVERVVRYSGTLAVDAGENGGVTVMGWDGDSVVVHSLIQAQSRTEDDARDIASHVTVVTANGSVHADGPPEEHRTSWSVSYRIYVPRHADLHLVAVNGPVSVQGVTGHMEMQAVNGPVSLNQVGGDVHARAENGPLDVALEGSRWDGTRLDAETENGPVDLTLPAHYAAHLETGTVNGPMDIDFPVTVQGDIDVRHLSLDIGGGGPLVRVVTTNGPVSVRHSGQ